MKDLVEETLFARRLDLFSSLDFMFFDTASVYFHGAGGDTLERHGHSREHRPAVKQMVVGMLLDGEGRPGRVKQIKLAAVIFRNVLRETFQFTVNP